MEKHLSAFAATNHHFTVHLGGIIELLSDALYTSETVFVRELIQNSVDAAAARRAIEPGHTGRVNIHFLQGDDGRWRLAVEDDGIGLLAEEVHQFLATIGASMKRSDLERRRNEDFIGQFGVGFLSCFMVADEVTLVTRRAGVPDAKGLKWEGRKDGTYTLTKLTGDHAPGSAVYLTLKDNTREYYDGARILELARNFARFLPVPIDFTSAETGSVRVNPEPFPWEKKGGRRGARRKQWLDFAEEMLREQFIAAFPIQCDEGGIRGIACLLRERVGSLDIAQHMVFLKGMFLSREIEGLAPKTMPFLRCIVNATGLKPNAAREGLQDAADSLWEARSVVGRGFRDFLRDLNEEDPRMLEEILRIHHRNFVELAAEDAEFLRLITPHLKFETNIGTKNLAELRRDGAPVRYIPSYEDFKRAEPFATSHGIVVVNAGYTGMTAVMRGLAIEFPGERFIATSARTLRDEHSREVEATPALRRLLAEARAALRGVRCAAALSVDARGRNAATLEVPVQASLRRDGDGDVPDFLRELQEEDTSTEHEPVLHLNTAHPLVEALCAPSTAPARIRAVVQALYHGAILAAREVPSALEDEQYHRALAFLLAGETEMSK